MSTPNSNRCPCELRCNSSSSTFIVNANKKGEGNDDKFFLFSFVIRCNYTKYILLFHIISFAFPNCFVCGAINGGDGDGGGSITVPLCLL